MVRLGNTGSIPALKSPACVRCTSPTATPTLHTSDFSGSLCCFDAALSPGISFMVPWRVLSSGDFVRRVRRRKRFQFVRTRRFFWLANQLLVSSPISACLPKGSCSPAPRRADASAAAPFIAYLTRPSFLVVDSDSVSHFAPLSADPLQSMSMRWRTRSTHSGLTPSLSSQRLTYKLCEVPGDCCAWSGQTFTPTCATCKEATNAAITHGLNVVYTD
jgi:hypothetical protein